MTGVGKPNGMVPTAGSCPFSPRAKRTADVRWKKESGLECCILSVSYTTAVGIPRLRTLLPCGCRLGQEASVSCSVLCLYPVKYMCPCFEVGPRGEQGLKAQVWSSCEGRML